MDWLGARSAAVGVVALLLMSVTAGNARAAGQLSMTGFSPTSGPVGTVVTITGSGFASRDVVTFNGTAAASAKPHGGGSSLTASVPAFATSGPIMVTDPNTGQTVGLPGTAFRITTGLALSLSRVWPGERMTVAGSGLSPDSGGTLMLGNIFLADARTDGNGNFQEDVRLPWNTPPGRNQVTYLDANLGPIIHVVILNSSWPQGGANPQRTANNLGETTLSTANVSKIKMRFDVPYTYPTANFGSEPVVAGGMVYVAKGYAVEAYDALTGALLWTYTTGDYIETTPAVSSGILFVSSDDSDLYALGASDGHFIWRVPFNDLNSSPLVANGVVYFGTESGFFYALGAADGHFIWDYQATAPIRADPAIAKGIVYFGATDDSVYAVHASNGTLVWRTVLACAGGCEGVHGSVGVADGVVLVPVNHGDVFGLNAGTHATLWAPIGYAFAVAGGVAYINDSYDGLVRAVQLKTGNELWDVICSQAGAPAYANGLLYLGCHAGSAGRELMAIDVTAGAAKEQYPLYVDLGPTVSGGTVYFTGRTNQPEVHLYAVGV